MAIQATFVADFSSFYEAVQRADVELREFQNNAEKVAGSLKNLTDKFSGRRLIEDATLMAKAIENVGGVSSLTANELAKASAKAAEAAEKMRALGIAVPPALEQLAAAAQHASTSTESLTSHFSEYLSANLTAEAALKALEIAFEAVVGAIEAFVEALQKCIEASAEAEQTELKLTAALQAQGTNLPSVIAAYDDYARTLQATTDYSKDAAKAAEDVFVKFGDVMPKDMQKALTAAANLATAMGTDLVSAATALSKAAEGSTAGLRRAGIVIDETAAKSMSFSDILDVVNSKLGGQAEAAAAGFTGRVTQMKNAWAELEEGIGNAITKNETLLELLRKITELIESYTTDLSNNREVMNLVSDAVILAVRGFGLFAGVLSLITKELAGNIALMSDYVGKLRDMATIAGGILEVMARARGDAGLATLAAGLQGVSASLAGLQRTAQSAAVTALEFGMAGQRIAGDAANLATQLEATRGQVHSVTGALQENAGAWDQDTGAAQRNAEALKANAEYLKELDQSMRQVWALRTEQMKDEQASNAGNYGPAERLAQLQQLALAEQTLTDWVLQFITAEKDRNALILANAKTQQEILNKEIALRQTLLNQMNTAIELELKARQANQAARGLTTSGRDLTDPWNKVNELQGQLDSLRNQAKPGEPIAEREEQLMREIDEESRRVAESLSRVVGAADPAAAAANTMGGAMSGAARSAGNLSSAMNSIASWAQQSASVITNSSAGSTDPRIMGLLSQGYTIGEAQAIVGGYGGMITAPGAGRKADLAGALSAAAPTVNLTMNGIMATDKTALHSAVSSVVMDALKAQRKFGNG
jgi:hypothetical protein